MKCPKCDYKIGKVKKYQVIKCKCGLKFMIVEINKKKEIVKV